MIQQVKESLMKIPVFTPNNIYIIGWRIIMLVLICIQSFIIPLGLSFYLQFEGIYGLLYIAVPIIFFIDILINFNTGYYHEGILEMER